MQVMLFLVLHKWQMSIHWQPPFWLNVAVVLTRTSCMMRKLYCWLRARLQYLHCISNGDNCSLALSHLYVLLFDSLNLCHFQHVSFLIAKLKYVKLAWKTPFIFLFFSSQPLDILVQRLSITGFLYGSSESNILTFWHYVRMTKSPL